MMNHQSDDEFTVDEVRNSLEARGLPVILREFVAACADEQPDDILSFMRDWALQRRPLDAPAARPANPDDAHGRPMPAPATFQPISTTPPPVARRQTGSRSPTESPSGTLPPSRVGVPPLSSDALVTSQSGNPPPPGVQPSTLGSSRSPTPRRSSRDPRLRLACFIGTSRSDKEPIVSLLEDAARFGGLQAGAAGADQGLIEALAEARGRLQQANLSSSWSTALRSAAAGRPVVFADVDSPALNEATLRLMSRADTVVLVVDSASAANDLRIKRQGELYNRAIAAHALGVKRLVCTVSPAPASDQTSLRTELTAMAVACGFDAGRTTFIQLPVPADDIADAIAGLPDGQGVKYQPQPARTATASLIVLNGAALNVGDVHTAFTVEPLTVRVDAIKSRSGTSPSKGDTGGQTSLRLHQTGVVELSIVSAEPRPVTVAGPLLIHKRGRVLAMGSVLDATAT